MICHRINDHGIIRSYSDATEAERKRITIRRLMSMSHSLIIDIIRPDFDDDQTVGDLPYDLGDPTRPTRGVVKRKRAFDALQWDNEGF